MRGDFEKALEHVNRSLTTNIDNEDAIISKLLFLES
jgi:hypothetical protein